VHSASFANSASEFLSNSVGLNDLCS